MSLQQPPADSMVLELIPCTILAFPLLPHGESEALSDADIYFASCTLRTCSSEFYSFGTVLSFVRHVSSTSHQQWAASIPQPQGQPLHHIWMPTQPSAAMPSRRWDWPEDCSSC